MKWTLYKKEWGDEFVLNWDFHVLIEGDEPRGKPMLEGSWFYGSNDGDPAGKLRYERAREVAEAEVAKRNAKLCR